MARHESGDKAESVGGIAEPVDTVGSDVEVPSGDDSDEEPLSRALRSRMGGGSVSPVTLAEWQRRLGDGLKERKTFTDFGRQLLEGLQWLDTPLGNFIRNFCNHVQPPPATEATFDRKGDLLPLHPAAIKAGENGVTEGSLEWVQLSFTMLNFNYCIYCTGWTKAICVPIDMRLTPNQKGAIAEVAATVEANILGADVLPSLGEAREALQSKRYDYAGRPVEYMQDLVADKVFPTWPKQGEAGIRCITEFLDGEALEAMRDPRQWILPHDMQPVASKRSLVRATDKEWHK